MDTFVARFEICIIHQRYFIYMCSMVLSLTIYNINCPTFILMFLHNIKTDFISIKLNMEFVYLPLFSNVSISTEKLICFELISNTVIRIKKRSNCIAYDNIDCWRNCYVGYYIKNIYGCNLYQTSEHVNIKSQKI